MKECHTLALGREIESVTANSLRSLFNGVTTFLSNLIRENVTYTERKETLMKTNCKSFPKRNSRKDEDNSTFKNKIRQKISCLKLLW